jgi:HSP20 family protein
MAKQHTTTTKTKIGNHEASLKTRTGNSDELAERLAATPFALMRRFSEEMENLFGDLGRGRGLLAPVTDKINLAQGIWSPQVEMFERDGELVVRADLPGLTKDDVNVDVGAGGITIEGERKHEEKEEREGYYRSERAYGKFQRTLPLPDGVDPEDAEATFRNGVLEVTMPAPKRTERKSRRLEIAAEKQQKSKGKAA